MIHPHRPIQAVPLRLLPSGRPIPLHRVRVSWPRELGELLGGVFLVVVAAYLVRSVVP